jgi:hypothetical protein
MVCFYGYVHAAISNVGACELGGLELGGMKAEVKIVWSRLLYWESVCLCTFDVFVVSKFHMGGLPSGCRGLM